jgi:uncharacterized protein YegJ (DUF2314 family)
MTSTGDTLKPLALIAGLLGAAVVGSWLVLDGDGEVQTLAGPVAVVGREEMPAPSSREAAGWLARPLREERVGFSYDVAWVERAGGGQVGVAEVTRAAARHLKGVEVVSELPMALGDRTVVEVTSLEGEPWPEDRLQYHGVGLEPPQQSLLQAPHRLTHLTFTAPAGEAFARQRGAILLVHALAEKAGGVVIDAETRQAFSPARFQQRRLDGWSADLPDVRRHIVIHQYQDGELMRSISLGMGKFGLPDVVVNGHGRSASESMGMLINLACQRMLEGEPLQPGGDRLQLELRQIKNRSLREDLGARAGASGGSGSGQVELAVGAAEPQEGDPENRLLELTFSPDDETRQQRQEEAICELFGCGEDPVHHLEHDEELLAVSAAARKKLPALKRRFQKGLKPGEVLQVKAPFKTSEGGNEWMWVEVVAWEGKTIQGILRNDPASVPGLKSGARVEVSSEDLFDYTFTRADGTEEGNETGRLMLKRLGQEYPE